MNFWDQYKHPEWQKKRLESLKSLDDFIEVFKAFEAIQKDVEINIKIHNGSIVKQ